MDDDRDAQRQTPVEVLTDLLRAPSGDPDASARAGALGRPLPGDRPPPAPRPPVLVVRAIAGAALSVFGVALGIVSLSWVDAAPERISAVSEPAAAQSAPTPTPTPTQTPTPAPSAPSPAVVVPPPAPSPTPTAAPRPARVPVTVLNNSRRSGLAARGAAQFRAGGWPVAAVGNFRGRIPVTTVYYDPGLEAQAREFATAFDGIARVRPRFSTLPARGVVVVLTREFPA